VCLAENRALAWVECPLVEHAMPDIIWAFNDSERSLLSNEQKDNL